MPPTLASTGAILRFEEEAARRLEAMYITPDVVAQRRWTREALALRPAEKVLDVGVGPGFLAAEMARAVGQSGSISGIDISEHMIAIARERCSKPGAPATVEFQVADATKLPFPDGSFDAVVSTQVYEFVADVDEALGEAHRVLRPGGRLLVVDTDWDSIVWHGADPALAARVLSAWEEHLAHAHLPGTLMGRLRWHGFVPQKQDTYVLLNPAFDENTYSYGLIELVKNFVAGRQGVTGQDAEAWAGQLREAGEAARYFFSLNRYLFLSATH
ncbi:MAG: methyltransferase domain-containing protein [Chloroflexi bacterium]|nr:MAG: methyltransferase domain-containing protein [Chloroflexota bacterium]